MMASVSTVQAEAEKVLGPLLARQAQGDTVRSVLALLRRQRGLFLLPSRLRACAARGDAAGALREWRAARALIAPDDHPVLHRVLAVAEREVNALEAGLRWVLTWRDTPVEAAEAAARLLLDIRAVRSGEAPPQPGSAPPPPTPAAVAAAAELAAAFAAGRGARLAAELGAAWSALEGALEERERKARRRRANAREVSAAQAGANVPMPGHNAGHNAGHRRTGSVELDKALSGFDTAELDRADAGARASADAAAELRLRFGRAATAAALRALPDMWLFSAALLGSNPGGASVAPSPLRRGASLQPLQPAVERCVRDGAEAACARLRSVLDALADGGAHEGHLRAALGELATLCRSLAEAGAPPAASQPADALRAWGLRRLVDQMCARMSADAAAAAATRAHAPAPHADVAAAAALLSLGGGPVDSEAEGADDAFVAARELRVSARPLGFCAALARGMALLQAAASEGGAAALAVAAPAARDAFFVAFANALAELAETSGVVNRDGSAPPDGAGAAASGPEGASGPGWEGAAMALLADSAFVRLWVLPALTHRFAPLWADAGGAEVADAALAEAEETLGALEEHVLGGYIQRHDGALAAAASAYFEGDGTDWARAGPPRGARDAALALLDALAASHAAAHARAGPFASGVVAALAHALLHALAAAASASAAPGGRLRAGLSAGGHAQLSVEAALLRDALAAYWTQEAEDAAAAVAEAALEAATATAKAAAQQQQQAASGSGGAKAGFSRTATRAALAQQAAAAVEALLPRERRRTALHTLCFRPQPEPPTEPEPRQRERHRQQSREADAEAAEAEEEARRRAARREKKARPKLATQDE
jgi:hypothetical protein